MKFLVCLISACLLGSSVFAQDLIPQKEKPKHIGLNYFSHLLPDPRDMVNFSGYMELEPKQDGAVLKIYINPVNLSVGGPKRSPEVAATLELIRVAGQEHVYEIFTISKSSNHYAEQIIFESKGTLDLTDAYVAPTNNTHVLARQSLKYIPPGGGETRHIGFFIPIDFCDNLKHLGGAI